MKAAVLPPARRNTAVPPLGQQPGTHLGTSGAAAQLPQRRVLFVPDRLMGENIRTELKRRGVDKEIITSDGTCIVHDEFTPADIADARSRFPGLKVVAHPECEPSVAALADFVGSTGAMMKYVRSTGAPYYLMLTECGLVGRLEVEAPEKAFIGGCGCPEVQLRWRRSRYLPLSSPASSGVAALAAMSSGRPSG